MSPSPPDLPWHPIPASESTCKVYLIQAGGLYIPYDMTLLPGPDQPNDSIKSNPSSTERKTFYAPDYVFLIEHSTTGNKYIFDLGMRKDLENLPPLLVETILPNFKCEPESPADILTKYGSPDQQPANIKAVIFSHMHFDHVGDGAQAGFHNAQLWLGPTTCTYARPGYPISPRAPTLSATLPADGSRHIIEAHIPDATLLAAGDARAGKVTQGVQQGLYRGIDLQTRAWKGVGAFERGYDCFGDGSAYVIDASGHSAGHQMMLVRTSPGSLLASSTHDQHVHPPSFILLAGDAFHHPVLLNDPRRTARPPYAGESMHAEPEVAVQTMWRARKMAEREEVWVVAAHDFSVGEAIEKGVKVITGLREIGLWREKGWKRVLEEQVQV
ncbi:hypothetical protein BDU57DRAFT_439569 [Ampelomyces quisqualis]|uniref:Metallo-beta-lactamase domain-containing protein n=1 Tax=Ampelomyces quisqualis TaxID=50730 RepID=A0A6A5QYG9_AMPQU|nr:hypothetical protein BDU57DRAFT_439569 [Ampelomyces quisqualis]